jgi:light-regulated signal transduction histidine kinase (bacteriophytochrome)
LPSNLSQKSSFQLFLWGLLLIPSAIIADAVLAAVLFDAGSVWEQLISPSHHALAVRILFSIFILAAIYLGMHYLANTAQKEGVLLQSNKDLDLVRQDFEEFHDNLLRQLRNTAAQLATSIELLKIQCDPQVGEKARFFLENVNNTSDRLNEQIEISMTLAELPFCEPRRTHVKLDKLALDVVEELKNKQLDRQITFKIQPWMTAWCDQKMLRQVIYSLFSNAMDFIPRTRQGQIEFGMFHRNRQKVFFVRDNGIGFSDVQANRLFDAFRDSVQDSDLPKDTIRLASARRIILRHGGQVWAEGIQNAGGTIFFTCNDT